MAAAHRKRQINGAERRGGGHANDTSEHELDDFDAALLQTFIAKRVLTIDNAIDVLGSLADITGLRPLIPSDFLEADIQVDQDAFEEAVSRINVAIAAFDFEIRKSLAQTTGEPLWAIVSPL